MTGVVAIWGARRASLGECAAVLREVVQGWRDVDPALGTWFRTGMRRDASAGNSIDLVGDAESFVREGRNFDDAGHVMEDLGFSPAAWTVVEGQDVGLEAELGCYSPRLPGNSVTLTHLPEGWGSTEGEDGRAVEVLRVMQRHLAPEFGAVQSEETDGALLDAGVFYPAIWTGEVTYLSRGVLPRPPEWLQAREWGEGVLVRAVDVVGSTEPAAMVDLATRLAELLGD